MGDKRLFLYWTPFAAGNLELPVGLLSYDGSRYYFEYVSGVHRALEQGYLLSPEFPDLHQRYSSQWLFALFANRVMDRKRRTLVSYLQSLALSEAAATPPISSLSDGDPLLVEPTTDGRSSLVLTTMAGESVGFVPHWYADQLSAVDSKGQLMRCSIERINYPLTATAADTLLVRLTVESEDELHFFDSSEFKSNAMQPIVR